MDIDEWDEYAHEEILQAAVRHLLTAEDLDQICADADLPALLDATGQPVTITAANSYRDAGVLTLDRGVWLELSDGSRFGLTVTCSGRPTGEVTLAHRAHHIGPGVRVPCRARVRRPAGRPAPAAAPAPAEDSAAAAGTPAAAAADPADAPDRRRVVERTATRVRA